MKKTLTTLFLTAFSALGFSQVSANSFEQPTSHVAIPAQEMSKVGTLYLKMGANESQLPKNTDTIMPELGAGYRHANGHHGVDVSMEGGARETRVKADLKEANYFYTLPKVNYLFYVSPASDTSFYAGAGAGVGGLREQTGDETAGFKTQEFHGIIPNVVLGQEFNRKGTVKSFVQAEVSQPALAVYKEGEFPTPRVSLFLGAGF